MATFAVTPSQGFTPVTDEGFPSFIQFQALGADLGGPDADTVNFSTGLTATRGTGENEDVITVTAETVPTFAWRALAGDGSLSPTTDPGSGIRTTGSTGQQVITIPGDTGTDDFANGDAVLIFQQGAASVAIAAVTGVSLLYRSAFSAQAAGQYATLTLIKVSANTWLLCGDLAAA
jgi:hypothetical protein